MMILNLGCGTSLCAHEDVVNMDWSVYLRLRRNPVLRRVAPLVLRGERLKKFRSLSSNIRVHNMACGLPYADASIDAVYHSHLLEHLDREMGPEFFAEVRRVLKPGGIHRIAVPDFERRCMAYVTHLGFCSDDVERGLHDEFVAGILEQSVRKEAFGSAQQGPLRRRLEAWLIGDARRRGETHQWMYDRINLPVLLERAGFREVSICSFNESRVRNWKELGLDLEEHRDETLYVEAVC
ncbi:MAG: methyltransferase domain-containing protein [Kiritimatiellaeota bacterium]|nr:methyltransferase domain-containing protein [Kiritimatiellota bacterium]